MEVASITLPTPTGGLNLIDAVDNMPPNDCIECENVYPDVSAVSVRNGQTLFGTSGLTGSGNNLISITGTDGTQRLLHLEANALVDMTTGTPASVTLPNNISATASWTIFNNRLFLFDGANTPIVYTPSAGTAAATGFTGITGGATTIVAGGSFKNVLCLIQTGTASFWYPAAAAISGACSEYNLAPFFKKGGTLRYVGSWTNQLASTSAELFVAVSSEGEVLCYSGDGPATALSTFSLVARYSIGRPLGYKAFIQLENDLWVITDQGIVSLTALFQGSSELIALSGMPKKINKFITDYALRIGVSQRWMGTFWPKGQRVYIAVPISTSQTVLLVCNLQSGAWCKYTFIESQKVASQAVFGGKIYGVNLSGRICEMETTGDDDGSTIEWALQWAWTFLGTRGQYKRIVDCRPIVYCFSGQQLQLGTATDFQNNPSLSTITIGVDSVIDDSEWDSSDWDTTPWGSEEQYFSEWHALSGQGHSVSFQMQGSNSTQIQINSVDLRVEVGSQI
jgi:hypothetical protein